MNEFFFSLSPTRGCWCWMTHSCPHRIARNCILQILAKKVKVESRVVNLSSAGNVSYLWPIRLLRADAEHFLFYW